MNTTEKFNHTVESITTFEDYKTEFNAILFHCCERFDITETSSMLAELTNKTVGELKRKQGTEKLIRNIYYFELTLHRRLRANPIPENYRTYVGPKQMK